MSAVGAEIYPMDFPKTKEAKGVTIPRGKFAPALRAIFQEAPCLFHKAGIPQAILLQWVKGIGEV